VHCIVEEGTDCSHPAIHTMLFQMQLDASLIHLNGDITFTLSTTKAKWREDEE
jgi:hypothetical protein